MRTPCEHQVALGVAPNAPTFSAVAAPLHPPALPNLSGVSPIPPPSFPASSIPPSFTKDIERPNTNNNNVDKGVHGHHHQLPPVSTGVDQAIKETGQDASSVGQGSCNSSDIIFQC